MYRHGQEDLQKALGDTLRKATGFIFKCAELALENTTNELANYDKDRAEIDTPKDQLSAKNGPPKCLKQAIRVKDLYGETIGTILERDMLLPVTVSRSIMLEDGSSYKVVADETVLEEFFVGPAPSSSYVVDVNVLVNIDTGPGALVGSVKYGGTNTEFKNYVRVQ